MWPYYADLGPGSRGSLPRPRLDATEGLSHHRRSSHAWRLAGAVVRSETQAFLDHPMRYVPVLIMAFAASLLASSAEAYVAPRRSVADVAFAIGVSRPGLPLETRKRWAQGLIEVAKAQNFDPLSGWAIIHHESRWRPGAVSPDGEDYGLAQIRARYLSACRSSTSSEACKAAKASLLDPLTNIRRMGAIIDSWRTTCRKITGKAEMRHWLAGYGGYGRLEKGKICGQQKTKDGRWRDTPIPKGVRDIMQLRRDMIRRIAKRRSASGSGAAPD